MGSSGAAALCAGTSVLSTIVIEILCVIDVLRRGRSRRPEHRARGRRELPHPALLLVLLGAFLVLSPSTLVENVDLGTAQRDTVPADDPVGIIAYTSINDREHGRGGQGRGRRSARSTVQIAVFPYRTSPSRRSLARCVTFDASRRRVRDAARPPGGRGRHRRSDPRRLSHIDLLTRRTPPTHIKLPAATILFLTTTRIIGPPARLLVGVYQQLPDRLRACTPSSAPRGSGSSSSASRRCSSSCPWPRSSATSTRSADAGSDRAYSVVRLRIINPTTPAYHAPFNVRIAATTSRRVGLRRPRHVRGVRRRHRARPAVAIVRRRVGCAPRRRLTSSTRHQRLDLTTSRSVVVPRPSSSTRRRTSRCPSRFDVKLQPLDGRNRRATRRRGADAASTSS